MNKFLEILASIPGEVYTSFFMLIITLILCLIIFIKVKHTDPLAKPKGIVHLAEILVTTIDNLVLTNMGKKYLKRGMGGYFTAISIYIFMAFTIGLFGLPTPMTNLIVPLSLGLFTFIFIHYTSIRATKWRYFKRYVEPFAFFLPGNLISMWAPLISLSFRLFGNALAGWTVMHLLYWALGMLSDLIFGGFVPLGPSSIFLTPLVAPMLHLYFDLFGAFIQTLVFISLSMIFISTEDPEEEENYQSVNNKKIIGQVE
jgi:F-type H+-transporting ATPase subunit a